MAQSKSPNEFLLQKCVLLTSSMFKVIINYLFSRSHWYLCWSIWKRITAIFCNTGNCFHIAGELCSDNEFRTWNHTAFIKLQFQLGLILRSLVRNFSITKQSHLLNLRPHHASSTAISHQHDYAASGVINSANIAFIIFYAVIKSFSHCSIEVNYRFI